ncbi:MAG: hypothetical protein ACTTKW_02985 [Schwartzia sp. (in: firmicutes)]
MKPIIFTLILASCLVLSAAPADAEKSRTVHEETATYALTYPIWEGDPASDAITADILSHVLHAKNAAEEFGYVVHFFYKRPREDDRYLSYIFLSDYHRKSDGYARSTAEGVVYDKVTGEKVPLSHFADVTTADLVRLYEAGAFHHYEGLPLPIDPVKRPTKVPEDYFITRWGTIFVLFDARELAPFQAGATAIDVTSLKHPDVSLPSV